MPMAGGSAICKPSYQPSAWNWSERSPSKPKPEMNRFASFLASESGRCSPHLAWSAHRPELAWKSCHA